MTKVRFSFVDVQGNPLPNMEFKLLLRRASFNAEDAGVVLPEELNVVTDTDGKVIVDLWPLKTAYRIQVPAEYEDLCGKLNWSFYVPVTDEIIEAQTLFLVPPPNNLPWDEEAMGKITQAVQDTQDSADSAKSSAVVAVDSANSAHTSASQAKASENAAAGSAASALTSKNAAAASQTSASQSAAAALTSKNDAAASAATSAAEAHQSNLNKIAAAASATDALASKNAAASSAADALASKNAAATSASQAAGSATAATNKAAEASTSAGTATTQAGVAKTEADRARAAANEASNKQPLNPKLTSLSGLPGGADRLAYFTGTDSMSQIGFGAAGRTLVSQGSYPEMRTTLGLGDAAVLNMTASADDAFTALPFKLTKQGDYGIGRQLGARVLPNVSTNRADVIKRATGVSFDLLASGDRPPNVVDGPMLTLSNDSTQGINVLFDWRTGTMYTFTDIIPAPFKKWRKFYHEDNIADTIDNGGLIESGKNSYGTFAKFRDGTLICSGEAQPLNGVGANVVAKNIATIFAMPFVAGSTPSIVACCRPSITTDHYGVTGVDFATADITTRFILSVRNGATAQNFRFWFTAVGRWK